jgi:hypothetical protein
MMNKIVVLFAYLLIVLSLNCASASEVINATPNDIYAYYGMNTPAGQTHSFAIEVDSTVYYITDSVANRLASYSPTFRMLFNYDLNKYSDMFKPDAISFGSNGFNAYYQLNNEEDDEMFQLNNDRSFSFEYASGQQVGYNSNAKVITKVYYPDGNEITETCY